MFDGQEVLEGESGAKVQVFPVLQQARTKLWPVFWYNVHHSPKSSPVRGPSEYNFIEINNRS